MNNFYIYAHVQVIDHTPFYIGKGKGDRAYETNKRSKYWKQRVDEIGNDYLVLILQTGLNESEALNIESDIISKLGTIHDGGILVNTEGSKVMPGTSISMGISLEDLGIERNHSGPKWELMSQDEISSYLLSFPYRDLGTMLEEFYTNTMNWFEQTEGTFEDDEIRDEVEFVLEGLEDQIEELTFSSERADLKNMIESFKLDLTDLDDLIDFEEPVDSDISLINQAKEKISDLIDLYVEFE